MIDDIYNFIIASFFTTHYAYQTVKLKLTIKFLAGLRFFTLLLKLLNILYCI